MKLLLIAVVISIHASGFLTTAEVQCTPRYSGGYGGAGGRNVEPGWTFNPKTSKCEQVMTHGVCRASQNCFPTVGDCESNCDTGSLKLEQRQSQY
uniref:Putative salivary kunitz domain protein n=1 Tax=Ixodes ricinus TaxID=34613 RepID=A0A0K8RL17_IXORI